MSRDNRRERARSVQGPADVIDLNDPVPVDAMSRSEVEQQVLTARRFPRNVEQSIAELRTMVLQSMESAALCIYSVPRGNSYVDGPSVRFAEALAYCMGNVRYGGRPVLREFETVMCVGVAWDCQRNNAATSGIKRQITYSDDKGGGRYNNDMIVMTENAGSAIAYRNAILHLFPEALWMPVWEAAREKAMGKEEPIEKLREKALRKLSQWGIKPERVVARMNVAKPEELTHEHIMQLCVIARQIKESEITIEQAFPPAEGEQTQPKPGESADDLLAAIVKADPEMGTVIDGLFKALGMNAAQRLQKLNEFKGRSGDLRLNLEDEVARQRSKPKLPAEEQREPPKERKRGRREPKEQPADTIVDALGGEPDGDDQPEPEPPIKPAKSSALERMRTAYKPGGSL